MNKAYPFWFYFLYYAALAAVAPFLVLFYQQLGFSGIQIGILTGMAPLIALAGGPFWSGVADATRRHRWVMSLAIGTAVLTGIILPWLRSMGAVMLVFSVFTFFTAPIIPLGDSATLASLGEEKAKYGRLRLGGTFGWAISAPLIGMLVGLYGLRFTFWCYSVLMFLALLVIQKFIFPRQVEGGSVRKGLGQLLTNRRWITFLGLAITAGMGFMTINNYLFAYMNELRASETVMGFALTLSTLAELPVLFFANLMLKKVGARSLLRVAVLLTGVRMLLFVVFDSVPGIMVAQLLNGLNFPLFWAAGVAYADENAPPGMQSTAQGVFGSVTIGIGSAVGGLLGGLLLDATGSRGMFLVAGLVTLSALAALILLEGWMKERISFQGISPQGE